MKALSGAPLNEKVIVKSFTKLMEDLEVCDNNALPKLKLSENTSYEITVLSKDDQDCILASDTEKPGVLHRFNEKTGDMQTAAFPLTGESMAAGLDQEGRLHAYAIQDDGVYYSHENRPYGSFTKPAQFTVTLPQDCAGIDRLILHPYNDGFSLFVISLSKNGRAWLTLCNSGETEDYLLPVSFGNGAFAIEGTDKNNLTVHLVDNKYTCYNIASAQLRQVPFTPPLLPISSIAYIQDTLFYFCDYIGPWPKSSAQENTVTEEMVPCTAVGVIDTKTDIAGCTELYRSIYNVGGPGSMEKIGGSYHLAIAGSYLMHLKIQPEGSALTAETPLPLDKQVSGVAFAQRETAVLYYYATENNQIVRLEYIDSANKWNEMTFDFLEPGEFRRLPCYSTEITLLEAAHKTPLAGTEVQVWTQERTYLETREGLHLCDEENPITLTTGVDGKIYVVQHTNDIDAAPIFVDLPPELLNSGEHIMIRQSDVATMDFAGITPQDILDGKTTDSMGTGQGILLEGEMRTEENAKALAEAINQAMNMHPEINTCPTCKGAYLVDKNQLNSVNSICAPTDGGGWGISLENNRLSYHKYTSEAADLAVLQAKQEGIYGGFFSSIGNFFRSVAKKITEVVKIIVKGVVATVTCIINGAKIIFEAVIKTVGCIINLVQSIFAMVLLFFVVLFMWLAALFQWADVKRTQKALSGCIDALFSGLPGQLDYILEMLLEGIDYAQGNLQKIIDEICEKVAPGKGIMQYAQDNTPEEPEAEENISNDVLLRNYSGGEILKDLCVNIDAGALQLQASAVADDLMAIFNFSETMHASDAFTSASDYLTEAFKDVDNLFGCLLSALLKAVEGLLQLALEGLAALAKAVVSAIKKLIEIIKAIIEIKIPIPFFSTLYEKMTGDTLTVQNLTSFLLSVLITTVHKFVMHKPPFEDNQQVDSFIREVEGCFVRRPQYPGPHKPLSKEWQVVCLAFSTTLGTAFYSYSAILDYKTAIKPNTPDPKPDLDPTVPSSLSMEFTEGLIAWLLELGWWGLSVPLIYDEDEDITWYDLAEWAYFGLGIGVDGGIAIGERATCDSVENGVWFTTIYGLGHIVVASIVFAQDTKEVTNFVSEVVGGVSESVKFTIKKFKPVGKWVAPITDVAAGATIFVCGIIDMLEKQKQITEG